MRRQPAPRRRGEPQGLRRCRGPRGRAERGQSPATRGFAAVKSLDRETDSGFAQSRRGKTRLEGPARSSAYERSGHRDGEASRSRLRAQAGDGETPGVAGDGAGDGAGFPPPRTVCPPGAPSCRSVVPRAGSGLRLGTLVTALLPGQRLWTPEDAVQPHLSHRRTQALATAHEEKETESGRDLIIFPWPGSVFCFGIMSPENELWA